MTTDTVEDLARGLHPVGVHLPLGRYVVEVFRRSRFMWVLATSQLRASYGRDRLGPLWLTLTPLLNALTYFVIFGVILNTRRGIENFVGFLIIGVFLYQYSASSITQGSRVIHNNRKLVQTLTFPRAVLPVALVLRTTLAFLPGLAIMAILVLAIPPHAPLGWTWLFVIPAVALQGIFNLGVVFILGRIVARVSDIANVLQFALRTWLYFSGVFFSYQKFEGHPTLLTILELNPMYAFLTITRSAVLYGEVPDPKLWLVAAGWSIPLLAIGLVMFWRAEQEYARV